VKKNLEDPQTQFDALTGKLNDTRVDFQIGRGDYQPLVYELDHARLEGRTDEAARLATEVTAKEPGIKEIFSRMTLYSDEKKRIQSEQESIKAPLAAAEKALVEAVPAKRDLDDIDKRAGGIEGLAVAELKPYQIYNPGLGIIDRCTACHVAADKPGYAKASWDILKGKISDAKLAEAKSLYATHPHYLTTDPKEFDWLSAHNVNKFGCTSCHWGNGPATTAPEKAHALEGEVATSFEKPMEYQLTPLLPIGSLEKVRAGEQHFGNMMEATCSKCHLAEMNLKGGPQLSYGRQLIEDLGCWGCHKIKGFEAQIGRAHV